MGFHFFIEFNHFSLNLDRGEILGFRSSKLRTRPKTIVFRLSVEELRNEKESWFLKNMLIKISLFTYFRQPKESMDFTFEQFELRIP